MLESDGATSDDKTHQSTQTIGSITQNLPPTLPEICAQIHEKVYAFLNAEPKDERTKAVQAQSRTSLGVIEEVLRRYRYARTQHQSQPHPIHPG